MRVAELWRYPVKSLQGERLEAGELTSRGLAGDRHYAIFDATTGFGLTARREPRLLFASARLRGDGTAEITLPDGSPATDDDQLSDWLQRPVRLLHCTEVEKRVYEVPTDDEAEDAWFSVEGAQGAFHDSKRACVSLLSTASMRDWPRRRFRANVILDGSGEDELVGSSVRLGGAELEVVKQLGRCVLVTRPQPGGIDKDLDVLRTIHRERGGKLAVGGYVTRPGGVSTGDQLTTVD